MLPLSLVAEMGWPMLQSTESFLADGSRCISSVHWVPILWHGQVIQVAALAMGDRPLVGTSLLVGNDIHIRFEEGGWFEVVPL